MAPRKLTRNRATQRQATSLANNCNQFIRWSLGALQKGPASSPATFSTVTDILGVRFVIIGFHFISLVILPSVTHQNEQTGAKQGPDEDSEGGLRGVRYREEGQYLGGGGRHDPGAARANAVRGGAERGDGGVRRGRVGADRVRGVFGAGVELCRTGGGLRCAAGGVTRGVHDVRQKWYRVHSIGYVQEDSAGAGWRRSGERAGRHHR